MRGFKPGFARWRGDLDEGEDYDAEVEERGEGYAGVGAVAEPAHGPEELGVEEEEGYFCEGDVQEVGPVGEEAGLWEVRVSVIVCASDSIVAASRLSDG